MIQFQNPVLSVYFLGLFLTLIVLNWVISKAEFETKDLSTSSLFERLPEKALYVIGGRETEKLKKPTQGTLMTRLPLRITKAKSHRGPLKDCVEHSSNCST